MPRTRRPIEEIADLIEKHDFASEASHTAQVEEMALKEQLCMPKEKVLRQRETFFRGMHFRGLKQMLEDADMGFI